METSTRYRNIVGIRLIGWIVLGLAVIATSTPGAKESVTRPAVVNADSLIADHGCADQNDPTHAVVTIDGQTRYVGQRLTDKAIEQVAFGVDHGLIVHRFCA